MPETPCPLPQSPNEKYPCEHFFRRLFERNKALILHEVFQVKGLMSMIMKHHSTGQPWTSDEKKLLRGHLRELAKAVPALFIFMLPFGAVFLPLLAMVLERRAKPRQAQPHQSGIPDA